MEPHEPGGCYQEGGSPQPPPAKGKEDGGPAARAQLPRSLSPSLCRHQRGQGGHTDAGPPGLRPSWQSDSQPLLRGRMKAGKASQQSPQGPSGVWGPLAGPPLRSGQDRGRAAPPEGALVGGCCAGRNRGGSWPSKPVGTGPPLPRPGHPPRLPPQVPHPQALRPQCPPPRGPARQPPLPQLRLKQLRVAAGRGPVPTAHVPQGDGAKLWGTCGLLCAPGGTFRKNPKSPPRAFGKGTSCSQGLALAV